MDKKSTELDLLKELIELDKLQCPMLLVTQKQPDGSIESNCPNKNSICYCRGKGQVFVVSVPDGI
ncbi:MAG: hypothetical protein ABIS36_25910 [Chryseolinea sp.]